MLTMSEMQSHDRFLFWEHFDDATANTEILMKSIIIFKFSPARRRLRLYDSQLAAHKLKQVSIHALPSR